MGKHTNDALDAICEVCEEFGLSLQEVKFLAADLAGEFEAREEARAEAACARAYDPEAERAHLEQLIEEARMSWRTMSSEDKEAMFQKQRESWVRGMAPCEHGVLDWETCPDCRDCAVRGRCDCVEGGMTRMKQEETE